MKVLFAVNNDEISDAIIKKYQKEYKEILSYKNVYYFNAILKELQKDNTYDRVIISEDLEPFANNNYDTIDKFIFEKLDNISDEATDKNGNDTDIILICSDRRTKSDEILIKLFGIGVYSAIIGNDRKIDEVCKFIHTPRTKREAKQYYKIESDNVMYQAESENSVSEAEVQNILAHYKRLGKNEEKYVDSFNNIVSQYTDAQLKIIIRYLPMGVKAVLEAKSQKYQELITFSGQTRNKPNVQPVKVKKEEPKINVKMLDKESTKQKIKKPIVVPSGMNLTSAKKFDTGKNIEEEKNFIDLEIEEEKNIDLTEENEEKPMKVEEQNFEQKKGRGRPRKNPINEEEIDNKPKRGRGRPKKNSRQEVEEEKDEADDFIDIFGIDDDGNKKETIKDKNDDDDELDLFEDYDNEEKQEEDAIDLFGTNEDDEEEQEDDAIDLFGTNEDDEEEQEDDAIDLFGTNEDDEEETKEDDELDLFGIGKEDKEEKKDLQKNKHIVQSLQPNSLNNAISKDKKVVAFVGTTKNGTSFIINNLAELLSSTGISTAILDMSKNKNAYYIYTNNDENLRETASNCIYKLKSGVVDGIKINKNLSIFTDIPGEEQEYTDTEIDVILNTLAKNFSVVLIDCDFKTPLQYFDKAQEIYIVQSMDVLTIQPLTAFLKQLKAKNILKEEKLRVIINKEQKLKNLPAKLLISGISKYNSPDMTLMDDLFNKDTMKYCIIPFEMQNYSKYLEALVDCSLSLNGYTRNLITALKELMNMVYPLIGETTYTPRGVYEQKNSFSSEVNTTLYKMKKNYQ